MTFDFGRLASIYPAVMAASTVIAVQTIVSRELSPTEAAVVTVGALEAGTKEKVIPDEAIIKLNVRTFDKGVRQRVLPQLSESSTARQPLQALLNLQRLRRWTAVLSG